MGVIFNLIMQGMSRNTLGLSVVELLSIFSVLCVIFFLEIVYAKWLWRKIQNGLTLKGWLTKIILIMSFCFYFSYTTILYSVIYGNFIFSDGGRTFPFYFEIINQLIPLSNKNLRTTRIYPNTPLAYPRVPLQCGFPNHPPNIVMILIDTWRFDMLNAEVTPHLSRFSQKATVFLNHWSGGNATGPGIFSLFYALPASYSLNMESEHRRPVFFDILLKQDYQIGIFNSNDLMIPSFKDSLFYGLENINENMRPGDTPNARDLVVTKEFEKFIREVKKDKPFYSLVYYDSAHGYCQNGMTTEPFKTTKECSRFVFANDSANDNYINRYKNAVYFIDQQVNAVLETLQSQDLLKNTVVVVTGDHGEEFNDSQLGFWGHASNFTRYQVQTPLILYYPKQNPQRITYQTSHFDVVPSLLTDILGCSTPFSAYSVGKHLLDGKPRPYLILSSYMFFGVLEPERITTIYPPGYIRVDQLNGQKMPNATLDLAVMQQVFADMRRFYKG
jgi:membrane-anchored protein YejM (alkaline phosphatase superfamily)